MKCDDILMETEKSTSGTCVTCAAHRWRCECVDFILFRKRSAEGQVSGVHVELKHRDTERALRLKKKLTSKQTETKTKVHWKLFSTQESNGVETSDPRP